MKHLSFFVLLIIYTLSASAQTAVPQMIYTDEDGNEQTEDTQYDGSAPFVAMFRANPEDVGDYTPIYEWRFTRNNETDPFLIRREEETAYTFNESGSFTIELYISFVQGTDTIADNPYGTFSVTISESKLEVPNAFTPNDDGINDVFKVKEGYESIISFRAMIFSRWGKKLYEWTDLEGGWDGTSGGHKMPDGAYYLRIDAKGADGRKYNIKKTISLLRGFSESTTTTN